MDGAITLMMIIITNLLQSQAIDQYVVVPMCRDDDDNINNISHFYDGQLNLELIRFNFYYFCQRRMAVVKAKSKILAPGKELKKERKLKDARDNDFGII